jgi:hypothetical protein
MQIFSDFDDYKKAMQCVKIKMPDGTIKQISKEEKDELLKDGKIELKSIPKFEHRKVDLIKYVKNYDEWTEKFPDSDYDMLEKLYIDLKGLLHRTRISFITPGFYLNEYMDALINYNLYNINRMNSEEKTEFITKCDIYVNSILISSKTLLDRLAPILSFFYAGISLETTFGRDKGNDKYSGLMSIVYKEKQSDEIMERIYDDYMCEFKSFILPRDTIIHYNDMHTEFSYPADGTEILRHYYNRIFSKDRWNYDDFIYYIDLSKKVNELYELYDFILSKLIHRKIVYKTSHFIKKKE